MNSKSKSQRVYVLSSFDLWCVWTWGFAMGAAAGMWI